MRTKTTPQLEFIIKDAQEAALAMRGVNEAAEKKYLDQINDATTELNRRRASSHHCPLCGQRVRQ
jgi:hypothetical protein